MEIKHIVACPGSRNAPIIQAFSNHPEVKIFSQVDERSAAFKALGMAEKLQKPVALVCTSGTALLNTYPALAEAFYKQIPLLIISADRPTEQINTWEGQSINQNNVFQNHCNLSFNFNNNLHENNIIDDLKNCFIEINNFWKSEFYSPAHINISLAEPLYSEINLLNHFIKIDFGFKENIINNLYELSKVDFSNQKILILNGYNSDFNLKTNLLEEIKQKKNCLILSDVCSVYRHQSNIDNWELFLNYNTDFFEKNLPDILITTGMGIVNKNLRNLLNKQKIKTHIHISENGINNHKFHKKCIEIKANLDDFFKYINDKNETEFGNSEFVITFKNLNQSFSNKINSFDSNIWNEWNVLNNIIPQLKSDSILHFANSMSIRYGSYLNQKIDESIKVYCNRATSGIDGCSSTFVGSALISDLNHYLITGDLAFLYDINAWWVNEKLPHCKIILLNNQEGEIFNLVKGAENITNSHLIHTPHNKNVEYLCKHFNINYYLANSFQNLESILTNFINNKELSLLEIKTKTENNINFFKYIKS